MGTNPELLEIALHPDVGQIGHHVRDDLEPGVFTQPEALTHRLHRVPAVRIPRYILIQTLHTDLQPSASIPQHIRQMLVQTIIRSRLNRNSHTLRL